MSNPEEPRKRAWSARGPTRTPPNYPGWRDLPLFFSAVALMLSGLTIYFSFFRDETRVVAQIIDLTNYSPGFPQPFNVAVMNTGNRQVAVMMGLITFSYEGGLTFPAPVERGTFPVLIEPGKMAIIALATNDPLSRVDSQREELELGGTFEVDIGLELFAIGATGQQLSASIQGIELEIELEDRDSAFTTMEVTNKGNVVFRESRWNYAPPFE